MDTRSWLGTHDRYARLRRIETLDSRADYREITGLFYGDFQSVMLPKGFAGFMFTFSSPRISRILSSTGELEKRIAKRFVDTTLLASAVMQHGFGPGRGADAARRVSAMHSHYDIHADDFVATACEEILVSLELAEKFGWRPVTDKEREAVHRFYSRQAQVFGSPKPVPGSITLVKQFFAQYLDTQLHFEAQNLRMAEVLIKWFCGLLPRPARRPYRSFLLSHVDPRMVRACGLPVPSKMSAWAAHAVMRNIGRKDPVPDGAPNRFETLVKSVYPGSWQMNELGTHLDKAPSSLDRSSVAEPDGGPTVRS